MTWLQNNLHFKKSTWMYQFFWTFVSKVKYWSIAVCSLISSLILFIPLFGGIFPSMFHSIMLILALMLTRITVPFFAIIVTAVINLTILTPFTMLNYPGHYRKNIEIRKKVRQVSTLFIFDISLIVCIGIECNITRGSTTNTLTRIFLPVFYHSFFYAFIKGIPLCSIITTKFTFILSTSVWYKQIRYQL